MFALPVVGTLASPVILNGVTFGFSLGGALVAWALIAAFVGTMLGLLRDATNPQAAPRGASEGGHVHTDGLHKEAA